MKPKYDLKKIFHTLLKGSMNGLTSKDVEIIDTYINDVVSSVLDSMYMGSMSDSLSQTILHCTYDELERLMWEHKGPNWKEQYTINRSIEVNGED
jgi:hypothetical protein